MTAKYFSNALGGIDESYIYEAITYTAKRKSNVFLKWGAMVACFCLVIGIAFRVAVGFVPNQAADIFREGYLVEIFDESELPAKYDGKILAFNLDFEEYELYYKADGSAENTADWYSLLSYKYDPRGKILLHCMFGDSTVDDWKVSSIFTKDATKLEIINGIEVQIARNEFSLQYEYWHYAIFEYDGVVYDVRVQSDEPGYVYEVLGMMINAE